MRPTLKPSDRMFGKTCTISIPTFGKDNAGGQTVTSTATLFGSFDCDLQDTNSTESIIYGGPTNRAVYTLFVRTTNVDGDAPVLASLPREAKVTIDGVVYIVTGAGVDMLGNGCVLRGTVERNT